MNLIIKKTFLDTPHDVNIQPKRGEKIIFNDGSTKQLSLLNEWQTLIVKILLNAIGFALLMALIRSLIG